MSAPVDLAMLRACTEAGYVPLPDYLTARAAAQLEPAEALQAEPARYVASWMIEGCEALPKAEREAAFRERRGARRLRGAILTLYLAAAIGAVLALKAAW